MCSESGTSGGRGPLPYVAVLTDSVHGVMDLPKRFVPPTSVGWSSTCR